MFVADPAGETRSGRFRIAAAGIEQQAAAVGKDELGLPCQRLDILARLKTDADRRAIEKGLPKESGKSHGPAIVGRAAERPAGRTEKGAIFIIAGIEIDRVEILLIRQVLHRAAVVGDLNIDIVAARDQRQRTEIVTAGLQPDLAIERSVAHETDGRFALQHELAIGLQDRRAETVEAAALAQHADPAHFDEGLLAANFGVEIAEIPAPEILGLVIDEARIVAREFIAVPAHAELLPQLRVALENEAAEPHGSVEVDRRRIGLVALPQIALDRAEVQERRKPRGLQRHIVRIFARRRENILDRAPFGRHLDHDHRQRAGVVRQLNPGLAEIVGAEIGQRYEVRGQLRMRLFVQHRLHQSQKGRRFEQKAVVGGEQHRDIAQAAALECQRHRHFDVAVVGIDIRTTMSPDRKLRHHRCRGRDRRDRRARQRNGRGRARVLRGRRRPRALRQGDRHLRSGGACAQRRQRNRAQGQSGFHCLNESLIGPGPKPGTGTRKTRSPWAGT